VRQSNPFRRATIPRRAARAKLRAGTPQNTSSSVSRAHCALAAAGRMQGPSHPARPQDTLLKVRANPDGSRSTRSTSTPAIDLHRSSTTRARARASSVFRPARARAGAPVRSRRAVTMRGRPTRRRPSTRTHVLSSRGARSRRSTSCECSARARIPYGVGPRRARLRRVRIARRVRCPGGPYTQHEAHRALASHRGSWKPSGRALAAY
jgi:hypothetical protein